MDSQWYNQAAIGMNCYDHQDAFAGINMDLNLKLGLPNSGSNPTHIPQNVAPIPRTPHCANMNFSGPYTRTVNHNQMASGGVGNAMNPYQMVSGEGNALGGQSYISNQRAWTPEMLNHYMNSSGLSRFTGPVVGVPAYTDPYNNFIFSQAPILPMQDYTLIDVSPRRVDRERGSSSGSCNKRRETSFFYPTKSCSNYNCSTYDTPMWRKGPFGPKTLCNACGIKYRKQEEKRKAKEAAQKSCSQDP